jgi:hypothetical protein
MPDTGAPWNLPYPSPSDLVRDAPQAFEDLAEAVADGLDDAGSEGIGPNVVQVFKDDAFTTATTGSWVDVTGVAASITPSSATSKVLVIISTNISLSGSALGAVRCLRDTTEIGSSTAGTLNGFGAFGDTGATNFLRLTASAQTFTFLDSPGVATSTTYKMQIQAGATSFVNRRGADTGVGASTTITLIEVKA